VERLAGGPEDGHRVRGRTRSERPSAKKALAACWVSFGWYFMPGNAHSGKTSIGGCVKVLPRKPEDRDREDDDEGGEEIEGAHGSGLELLDLAAAELSRSSRVLASVVARVRLSITMKNRSSVPAGCARS
jgi:hypothetical protein